MFLFIICGTEHLGDIYNSNTSHVLIYPTSPARYPAIKLHSNTSHVLIYRLLSFLCPTLARKFKYISCSYLSYSLPISYYYVNNPNTSHVLIYLRIFSILVSFVPIQIHLMFLFILEYFLYWCLLFQFKYISCSYLSVFGWHS